jgi:hypothetical protein
MPSIAASNTSLAVLSGSAGTGFSGPAFQTASVVVGPSDTNEITVTATGISTWVAPQIPGAANSIVVSNVFLQARQAFNDNQDNGFPDVFAVQFIMWGVAGDNDLQVTFTLKRLDSDGGWGQSLQVDILLVTFLNTVTLQ